MPTVSKHRDISYFGNVGHEGRTLGPDLQSRKLGRNTMAWEGDLSGNEQRKDHTKINLCGKGIRNLNMDIAKMQQGVVMNKVDAMYLRANEISSLAAFQNFSLGALRILDLSFNEVTSSELPHLAACVNLHQVFLNGNRLKTLATMPVLERLEVLVASNCFLSNLKMPVMPALQLLGVSDNRLAGFAGLPTHPNLHVLQMSENAALKGRDRLDTAAVLLCGEQLAKFSGKTDALQPISKQVLEDAKKLPAYAVGFLKMGWVLPSDEELSAEGASILTLANDYLRSIQAKSCIPQGWALERVNVDPAECGVPCRSVFQATETEHRQGLHIQPGSRDLNQLSHTFQWYRSKEDVAIANWQVIEGATNDSYIPEDDDVGFMLKVVCTVHEPGFQPIYGLSDHVVIGSRVPKATVTLSGFPMEGEVVTASAHVVWCRTLKGTGSWQWWKTKAGVEGAQPEQIVGAEAASRTLLVSDVGYEVSAHYVPVSKDGIQGPEAISTTPVVEQHPPVCKEVHMEGSCKAGTDLVAVPTYFGGVEGASQFRWYRSKRGACEEEARKHHLEFELIQGASQATLEVTGRDVGCFLKVEFTPVCATGEYGPPGYFISPEPMQEGNPVVSELDIVGELIEGETVYVEALYNGGMEGLSRIQWFAVDEEGGVPLAPPTPSRELVLPLEATNKQLEVHYTPVRADGVEGKKKTFLREQIVKEAHPTILNLNVQGDRHEGSTLQATYKYLGGVEGDTKVQWLRCNPQDAIRGKGAPVVGAAGLSHLVGLEDVGASMVIQVTPTRSDGMVGTVAFAPLMAPSLGGAEATEVAVMSLGPPQLKSLVVQGDASQGATLTALAEYAGSAAHTFLFQWFRRDPGAERPMHLIEGADGATIVLSIEDVGKQMVVRCTPVRAQDGAKGPHQDATSQEVTPALPVVTNVKVTGHLMQGEEVSIAGTYFGGDFGSYEVEWSYQPLEGGELVVLSHSSTYRLDAAEVGCVLVAQVTPVRADGARGSPVEARSDFAVKACAPKGVFLSLPQSVSEVRAVVPEYKYMGGKEGISLFEWVCVPSFRKVENLGPEEIKSKYKVVAESPSFTPCDHSLPHEVLVVIWTPVRDDGAAGSPLTATTQIVLRGPEVDDVTLEELEVDNDTLLPLFRGTGTYFGGTEGESTFGWWRIEDKQDAQREFILETFGRKGRDVVYQATPKDYGHRIVFSYEPKRCDGVKGQIQFSELSDDVILPPPPSVSEFQLVGPSQEAEPLVATCSVAPRALQEGPPAPKVLFVWKRAYSRYGSSDESQELSLEDLNKSSLQNASAADEDTLCSADRYVPVKGDIGSQLVCTCAATDVFGRSSSTVMQISAVVKPGLPRITKLAIGWFPNLHNTSARPTFTGTPYHTCRFVASGEYVGGFEGSSTVRWSRRMVLPQGRAAKDEHVQVHSMDNSFDACVEDVGYVLIAAYTPVRTDGTVGTQSAKVESPVVQADPEVEKEVVQCCKQPFVKFDVELVAGGSGKHSKDHHQIEMNSKRVKLTRPGFFSHTEARSTYGVGFGVNADRSDPRKLHVTLGDGPRYTLSFTTQRQRDVAVQVMRRFSNSC